MKYNVRQVSVVVRPFVVTLLFTVFFPDSYYAQTFPSNDSSTEMVLLLEANPFESITITSADSLNTVQAAQKLAGSIIKRSKQDTSKKLEVHSFGINQQKGISILAGVLGSFFMIGFSFHRRRSKTHKIDELNNKIEELRITNEQLTNSYQELRQFTHTSLKDLHDSIMAVRDFSASIEARYKKELGPESNEHLRLIKTGVQKIDKSLVDLINNASIGIWEQQLEPLDLEEIIDEIIYNRNIQNRMHGMSITTFNLQPLIADARQMRILFDNLIENAIKFRADNNPTAEIGCVRLNDIYLFSVEDNGVGKDETESQQLLDSDSSPLNFKGEENSLSICRKIVQQHNGRFWIEPKKEKGTTVFFELPHSPQKK